MSVEISQSIAMSPSLQFIDLSHNPIGLLASQRIASMFLGSKTIRVLILGWCEICDQSNSILLQAIKTTGLRKLYLNNNKLSVYYL